MATVTIDLRDVVIDDVQYDYGIVKISDAVYEDHNSFYWDGKDSYGNPLPEGIYNKSSIQISIDTHSGAYHFPLLDVENMPNGIKVKRISNKTIIFIAAFCNSLMRQC